MGCDIHGIIEQRKPGGQWEGSCVTIELRRNYSVFANLCGVRGHGDETPVAPDRGIPADACEKTRTSSGKGGIYHSHSWCTVDELKEALAQAGDSHHESYLHLTNIMDSTELFSHECRFVFWFDN